MTLKELKQKIAEREGKIKEQIRKEQIREQEKRVAKEQLYFACEKLCDAALSARYYCPETVQQTIDDAVKDWKEIQQAMN